MPPYKKWNLIKEVSEGKILKSMAAEALLLRLCLTISLRIEPESRIYWSISRMDMETIQTIQDYSLFAGSIHPIIKKQRILDFTWNMNHLKTKKEDPNARTSCHV